MQTGFSLSTLMATSDKTKMAGIVADETQDSIPPTYVFYYYLTLAALNIAFSLTAFIGNILILIALHKESSLHPPSKLLYRCLSFTDLCVGVFAQPVFAGRLIKLSIESDKLWEDTSWTAVFSYVTGTMLCGISLTALTFLSVDRMLALLLKMRYRQVVTFRRVQAIVLLMWLCFGAGCLMYQWYPFLLRYIASTVTAVNLTASSICYLKIYITLRQQQAQVQSSNGSSPLNIACYKKTVFTALYVQLALVICYLPFAFLASLGINFEKSPLFRIAYSLSIFVTHFNSSLNPVLYCWRIKDVRKAVKETVRQLLSILPCFGCVQPVNLR